MYTSMVHNSVANMALLQVWCSVALIAIDSVASSSSSSQSQELFFGLVGDQESSRAKSGVEDALNDINKRGDLLSNYKLSYYQYAPRSPSQSQVIISTYITINCVCMGS